MSSKAQSIEPINLVEAGKLLLIAGGSVGLGIGISRLVKYLSGATEVLKDLPVDKTNLTDKFDPSKIALVMYDVMKGVNTSNLPYGVMLNYFNSYNDDMIRAIHNSWNNTIPNQGKSLYTWINSEYCMKLSPEDFATYEACKSARSKAIHRLIQAGAGVVYK